jgi:uncharacterized membrane protein YraQ (UPF0718 family)
MQFFDVLNNIFLKMTWLSDFVTWILNQLLNLDNEGWLFGMIQFFLYDTVKIFILLMILIFLVSYIQSYFPPERTTKILQKYRGIKGNIIGALLGTLTPFCSCSSIPIFIGFTKAGLPIGITFSFLISSPLVDLASFLLLLSFLGWEVAVAYVVIGIVLAVVGGLFMDKAHMEKHLQDFVKDMQQVDHLTIIELTRKERISFSIDQVKDIIRRVWLYILIGVLIGATIHNVIPESFIESILARDAVSGVLIATIVGVPMYADIFGTIPIAEALLFKGIPLGTILSFMMAVTALSVPSLILLKQVVKQRLLWTFVAIVTIGILVMGIVFNLIYLNFMI